MFLRLLALTSLLVAFSSHAKDCDDSVVRTAIMVDNAKKLGALSKNCTFNTNQNDYLHLAAKFDATTSANWLLQNGGDARDTNTQKETPLHYTRSITMAKLLLSAGARPDRLDRWERTPFQVMLSLKDWSLLNFMLENGSAIRQNDLDWAADYYHLDILDYLADNVAKEAIQGQGSFFRTFHFYEDDYQRVAAKLVSKGADIDASRSVRTQRTPLVVYVDEYARNSHGSQKHGLKAIRFLLEMGANPNQFSKRNSRSVFSLALMKADIESNLHLLDLFLKHGLDLNSKSSVGEGRTALMDLASKTGIADGRAEYELEMIQALLEKGASPDVQSNDGRTALHYAIRWAHALAGELLAEKTNLELRDKQGRTALDYAYERLTSAPSAQEKRALSRIIKVIEKR